MSKRARAHRRAVRRRHARQNLREQALALQADGLGYRRIAKALGLTVDQVRGLIRPGTTCPDCGCLKSPQVSRCRPCSTKNRKSTERRTS